MPWLVVTTPAKLSTDCDKFIDAWLVYMKPNTLPIPALGAAVVVLFCVV